MRKRINKTRLILFTFLLLILLFVLYIIIKYLPIFKPSIEKIKDSVVMVEVYDKENNLISTGSGFCAYKKDFIVTNFHVIEGGYSFKIIDDNNRTYKVDKIVIFNKDDDLAILQFDGELKRLKINSKPKIHVKDQVTAIGSPKGELNTVSEGIISNVDDKDLIRISVPISHGSSGGVLLNKRSEVIGITSAGYDDAENLNFAIRSKLLNSMYTSYKTNYYDIIDDSNYRMCTPNIYNYNTQAQLQMKEKCEFSGKKDYSVDSFDVFYKTTDSFEIFNTAISKGELGEFKTSYMSFSQEEKRMASNYYTELLQYEDCNTEINDGCTIDNIDNWDKEELIMELDVMPTYALAIFEVAKDKYNANNLFDYVNSLPLSIPQKGILLILYKTNNRRLADNNYKAIIEYVNSKNITIAEKGKILSYLGFKVDGGRVSY